MGRKCNVKDCPSDSNRSEDTGVTFHKMPLHQDLRPKWIQLCRIPEDKQQNRVIYVCSRHFLRADFCNFKGTKYMLRQGALPSVFPWTKVLPKPSKADLKSNKTSSKDSTTKTKQVEKEVKLESSKKEAKLEKEVKVDGNKKESTGESKSKKESKSSKKESKATDKELKIEIARIEKEMNSSSSEPTKSKIEMKIEKDIPEIIQTKIKTEKPDDEGALKVEIKTDLLTEETDPEIKYETSEDSSSTNIEQIVKDEGSISTSESVGTEPLVKTEDELESLVPTPPLTLSMKKKSKPPKSGLKTSKQSSLSKSSASKNLPQTTQPTSRSTTISFTPGLKIQALDFNQCWYPARVVEVDYEEHEVLIHFEKFSHRYDEWIQMDSPRLKPFQAPTKIKNAETYNVGERCMAVWSDCKRFPATITRVLPESDSYEVLFDDGFIKCLKHNKLSKMTHVPEHLPATSTIMAQAAPLFEPATGSKQERRDRKRKIASVAELFSKKRFKEIDDYSQPIPVEPPAVETEEEEWTCRWVNGEPVGIESVLEANDGQSKRKSIIVEDHRLPEGWQKHFARRTQIQKYDCIIVNPEGRRFRSKMDVQKYLEENPHLNYSIHQFDFSLHLQRARKIGLYEITTEVAPTPPKPVATKKTVEVPETPPPPPKEEENTSGLKILWENDSYKCPIEGCGKNFRKENLAQMHVKHYHPEYSQLMGSTPNVADLAYARTVGESLEKTPVLAVERPRPVLKVSTPKTPTSTPKLLSPNDQEKMSTPMSGSSKQKDSEIIKLLNKPSSYDFKPNPFDSQAIDDAKLRDLLCKSEAIPRAIEEQPPRVGGIKTLLPVSRRSDAKEPKLPEEMLMESDSTPKPPHSTSRSGSKRRRQVTESYEIPTSKKKTELVDQFDVKDMPSPIVQEPLIQPQDTIISETGEVIKIVHMRREEIINCTCGITEEDGLMIQCELCFCWQHAYCNGIERESQVPEKYVCYICQHPKNQRPSKKYFHDQDWLKHGNLPTANYHCKDEEQLAKRFELLKKSHQISGALVELKDFIHSMSVKINIAKTKNHPKLYLWSKIWEKSKKLPKEEPEDTKDKLNTSDSSYMKGNDFDILNVLSMLKPEDNKDSIPKIDLLLSNRSLMSNNLEQIPTVPQAPVVPQPEAAIESADCRLNLLEHIEHYQKQVDERLDEFEAQIDQLDSGNLPNETDDNCPTSKQTLLMLLKDLNSMKQLAALN